MAVFDVWCATGLQPGLTYQISEDLDRGDVSLVMHEPLFDILLPMVKDQGVSVDCYGMTTIPAATWRNIALDVARQADRLTPKTIPELRFAGLSAPNAGEIVESDPAQATALIDGLRTVADWLARKASTADTLTIYGI